MDEQYLAHYGVKGMHWGIRKDIERFRSNRQNKKIEKMAKKDAKRYLDAKMYYGDGAGTRRKLLKAELNKKQKDPVYKKHFDKYVSNGDVASSAKKAVRTRHFNDTKTKVSRTTKNVMNMVFGSSSVIAVGLGLYMTDPRVKSRVNRYVGQAYNKIKNMRI